MTFTKLITAGVLGLCLFTSLSARAEEFSKSNDDFKQEARTFLQDKLCSTDEKVNPIEEIERFGTGLGEYRKFEKSETVENCRNEVIKTYFDLGVANINWPQVQQSEKWVDKFVARRLAEQEAKKKVNDFINQKIKQFEATQTNGGVKVEDSMIKPLTPTLISVSADFPELNVEEELNFLGKIQYIQEQFKLFAQNTYAPRLRRLLVNEEAKRFTRNKQTEADYDKMQKFLIAIQPLQKDNWQVQNNFNATVVARNTTGSFINGYNLFSPDSFRNLPEFVKVPLMDILKQNLNYQNVNILQNYLTFNPVAEVLPVFYISAFTVFLILLVLYYYLKSIFRKDTDFTGNVGKKSFRYITCAFLGIGLLPFILFLTILTNQAANIVFDYSIKQSVSCEKSEPNGTACVVFKSIDNMQLAEITNLDPNYLPKPANPEWGFFDWLGQNFNAGLNAGFWSTFFMSLMYVTICLVIAFAVGSFVFDRLFDIFRLGLRIPSIFITPFFPDLDVLRILIDTSKIFFDFFLGVCAFCLSFWQAIQISKIDEIGSLKEFAVIAAIGAYAMVNITQSSFFQFKKVKGDFNDLKYAEIYNNSVKYITEKSKAVQESQKLADKGIKFIKDTVKKPEEKNKDRTKQTLSGKFKK